MSSAEEVTGPIAADNEPSIGERLPTDERAALVVLVDVISRDHRQISGTLDRMADALERLEQAHRDAFLRRAGDVLLSSWEGTCRVVTAHKWTPYAVLFLCVLLPTVGLLWAFPQEAAWLLSQVLPGLQQAATSAP